MALIITLLIILSIPLWGYPFLQNRKMNAGTIAWILTIGFNLYISFFIVANPLVLMMLYIMSTFLSMKMLVVYNHLGRGEQLDFRQWLLFCYCWFGMNPRPFLAFPSKPFPDAGTYIIRGISRILAGWVLIKLAGFIFIKISNNRFDFILHLSWLIGVSLILHFGILNISTGFLRKLGVGVGALFKDPIQSKSLAEFWSRRWNIAFVELTTIAVLRPVRTKFGDRAAFWASYVFSGLLHEMAISLPVKSGFGKPFLYFMIQAVFIMTVDRWLIKKMTSNFFRTCLILACLFLPIFLLFHEQFIEKIIVPLVGFL